MESSLKGRAAFLATQHPRPVGAIGEGPWPVPFKVKLGQTWHVFSVEHPGQACPSSLPFFFQNKSLFSCPAHIFVDYLEGVRKAPRKTIKFVTSHMGELGDLGVLPYGPFRYICVQGPRPPHKRQRDQVIVTQRFSSWQARI